MSQYTFACDPATHEHGMVWNGVEDGLERSFWYGIWKIPEWNGRLQEWNGRQSCILPYQFHSRFRTWHLQKNMYG